MDDAVLTVKTKIANGILRADAHAKSWFEIGTNNPCAGCDRVIEGNDIEVEVDFWDAQRLRFHRECFDVWTAHQAAKGS